MRFVGVLAEYLFTIGGVDIEFSSILGNKEIVVIENICLGIFCINGEAVHDGTIIERYTFGITSKVDVCGDGAPNNQRLDAYLLRIPYLYTLNIIGVEVGSYFYYLVRSRRT